MSEHELKENRKRSLERKLAAYSAAAGASLLAAAGADAQTIYTDFPDTTLNFATPIYLDLNQDGPPGLGLDAMDDLALSLGAFPVEKVGKTGGVVTYLLLNPLSNSYVYGLRILGNYPTCSLAYVGPQSFCSAAPAANCFLSPPGEASRKRDLIPVINSVPLGPSTEDQFIRIGGFVVNVTTAASKAQGLGIAWEGWIRVNVQVAAPTPGDTALSFQVVVKDHAIFINDPAPISCDAASLPVEFVSFDAQVDAGAVELSWETASEINNAGFQVEYRPADQPAFAPLGFVEGAGSTTAPQHYAYSIDDLEPGRYLFRLKQIDLDGAFKYTDELEVTVEVPGTHFLSNAYPNPFNPQAHFSLVVPTEQTVRVELFDALGRSVSLLHDGVVEADTPVRFVLQGEDLPSGTYLYRATGETFSEAKQVVLAK